ncbi:MAG: GNAT family N-acetyltransferase [Leptospiraceae bacterium]|nr:GNAT family N-acetyltransferase [Leptospiraceae bacterium]
MAITFTETTKGVLRKLEVRLAENQLEVEKTLQLRYNVFNLEMGEGLPQSAATQKDRDEYDYYCDHLIVVDKNRDDQIVGTYRIQKRETARENMGFYSENEFDLRSLYRLEDEVAEVGRSCVHPEYRNGSVISLLWAGIGEYIQKHNIRYLMGCGSIHSTDPLAASEVYAFLKAKDGLADNRFSIEPLDAYKIKGFNPNFQIDDLKTISKKIPPLIKGYLRLGAKICGVPALDPVFKTTDVFVLFDSTEITERYLNKYLS